MKVDEIITLANNQKYGLLLESELTEEDYFIAVLLNEKEEPTNTFAVFEQVIRDDKIYTKKIKDPFILNQLINDFRLQQEDITENGE